MRPPLKKPLLLAWKEAGREGGERNTSGFVSELGASKSNITSKNRRERSKLHTVPASGGLCGEVERLLPSGTKQHELHPGIPFLPSVSHRFFSNHQHSPERYKGSWLLQNVIANIFRHSPNIAEIFCPYITVLYIFFYLACEHRILFFFCPFFTIVTQILNFSLCWVEQWEFFYHYFKCFSQAWFKKG